MKIELLKALQEATPREEALEELREFVRMCLMHPDWKKHSQVLLEFILSANDPDSEEGGIESTLAYLAENTFNERCGKIFAKGEFSYSCVDCQADATCVFCLACFKKSNHEGHQYSFHRSSGGGICDCGDPEAWNPMFFCSDHKADASSPIKDPAEKIPVSIKKMVSLVSQVLAEVIGECLSDIYLSFERVVPNDKLTSADILVGGSGNLEKILEQNIECSKLVGGSGNLVLLLHNDDVHIYDEIEAVLGLGCGKSKELAQTMTKSIDVQGRVLILEDKALETKKDAGVGNLTSSQEVPMWRSRVNLLALAGKMNGYAGEVPLLITLTMKSQLQKETMAIRCLDFVGSLFTTHVGLGALSVDALLQPHTSPTYTTARYGLWRYLVSRIVDTGLQVDLGAVTCGGDLYSSFFRNPTESTLPVTLIGDFFKFQSFLPKKVMETFSVVLNKCFLVGSLRDKLGEQFILSLPTASVGWGLGVGTKKEALFDFGVQLLTVPSLIRTMSTKLDVIGFLIWATQNIYEAAILPNHNDQEVLNLQNRVILRKRYFSFINNLGWAVSQMKLSALSDFGSLLSDIRQLMGLMAYTQEFYHFSRHLGQAHRERAHRNLQASIHLELHHDNLYTKIAEYIVERLQPASIDQTIEVLRQIFSSRDGRVTADSTLVPLHNFAVSEFPIWESIYNGRKLSYNLSWQRMVARVVVPLINNGSLDSTKFVQLFLDESKPNNYLEYSLHLVLTAVAASCQIFGSLWRRTGVEVLNMAFAYYDYTDNFMLDIDFCRLASLRYGSEAILSGIIRHCGLSPIFDKAMTGSDRIDAGFLEFIPGLLQEVMTVIYLLYGESLATDAEMSLKHRVRRTLINQISVSPPSFSDLMTFVERWFLDDAINETFVQDILAEISDFVGGSFSLKTELWPQVDPYGRYLERSSRELIMRNKLTHFGKTASWTFAPILLREEKYDGDNLFFSKTFIFGFLRKLLLLAVPIIEKVAQPSSKIVTEDGIQIDITDVIQEKQDGMGSIPLLKPILYGLEQSLQFFTPESQRIQFFTLRDDLKLGSIWDLSLLEILTNFYFFYQKAKQEDGIFENFKWTIKTLAKNEAAGVKIKNILKILKKSHLPLQKSKPKNKALAMQRKAAARMQAAASKFIANSISKDSLSADSETSEVSCGLCRGSITPGSLVCYNTTLDTTSWGRQLTFLNRYEVPPRVLGVQRAIKTNSRPVLRRRPGYQIPDLLRSINFPPAVPSEPDFVNQWDADVLSDTSQEDIEEDEALEQYRKQAIAKEPQLPRVSFCRHLFHESCLDGYLNSRRTYDVHAQASFRCPICQKTCNIRCPAVFSDSHQNNASIIHEISFKTADSSDLLSFLWPDVQSMRVTSLQMTDTVEDEAKNRFDYSVCRFWAGLLHPPNNMGMSDEQIRDTVYKMILGIAFSICGMSRQASQITQLNPRKVSPDLVTRTETVELCLSHSKAFVSSCDNYLSLSGNSLKDWFTLLKPEQHGWCAFLENQQALLAMIQSSICDSRSESQYQSISVSDLQATFDLIGSGPKTSLRRAKLNQLTKFIRNEHGNRLDYVSQIIRFPLCLMFLFGMSPLKKIKWNVDVTDILCIPITVNESPPTAGTATEERLSLSNHPLQDNAFEEFVTWFGDSPSFGKHHEHDVIVSINGVGVNGRTEEEMKLELETKTRSTKLLVQRTWETGALLDIVDFSQVLTLYSSFIGESVEDLFMLVRLLAVATVIASAVRTMRRASWYDREQFLGSTLPKTDEYANLWEFCWRRVYTDSLEVLKLDPSDFTICSGQRKIISHNLNDFLMKSFILLHSLSKADGKEALKAAIPNDPEDLFRFFGIPPIDSWLQNQAMSDQILAWIDAWKECNPCALPFCYLPEIQVGAIPKLDEVLQQTIDVDFQQLYRSANHFIDLPESYEDLYEHVSSNARCSTTGKRPEDPIICLRCGAVLCFRTPCCELLGKTLRTHFQKNCNAPFLWIAKCELILPAKDISVTHVSGGTVLIVATEAPYKDSHGETDQGLNRGKPLTLDVAAYRALEKTYINGESYGRVSREIEENPRAILNRTRDRRF